MRPDAVLPHRVPDINAVGQEHEDHGKNAHRFFEGHCTHRGEAILAVRRQTPTMIQINQENQQQAQKPQNPEQNPKEQRRVSPLMMQSIIACSRGIGLFRDVHKSATKRSTERHRNSHQVHSQAKYSLHIAGRDPDC